MNNHPGVKTPGYYRVVPAGTKNGLAAEAGGVTVEPAMKTLSAKANTNGFTLIELLLVIFMIAVLAAMLLPSLAGRDSTTNVRCMNNLKQIGIGYDMWASDHEGQFPAEGSIAKNGSLEFVSTGYASLQFRALSEFTRYPNVFVCPADKTRQAAANSKNLREENLSYFINVDATTNNPSHTILAGDRNLQANGQPVKPGLFELTTNLDSSWTHDLHLNCGVLVFADGHAERIRTNELNSVIQHQSLATNRLCVP